jgi:hypothetical protein
MLLTILIWTILAALLVMQLAPDSSLGRSARHTLVEAPARLLLDMTWRRAGKTLVLAIAFALLLLAGPETIMMLTVAGGDLAAMELLLAVWAASVSGGLAVARRKAAAMPGRMARLTRAILRRGSGRETSRRRRRKGLRMPRKDEDAPGCAFT